MIPKCPFDGRNAPVSEVVTEMERRMEMEHQRSLGDGARSWRQVPDLDGK